jgi:Mrp family chromosome partitioning ATPase
MSFLGQMLGTDRAEMQMAHLRMICQGLLFRIVQQSKEKKDTGFVIALTSPTPGAGVSHITTALTDALNKSGGQYALAIDCKHLNADSHDSSSSLDLERRLDLESLWQMQSPAGSYDSWYGVQDRLDIALDNLRRKYRYILVDCPSLKESQDAIRLAPYADGVVLVVEANRTQREQLLYAERTIEGAKGRILGHVLNKRSYVIPNWLSFKMEAIGL